MVDFPCETSYTLQDLRDIMVRLRSKDGCPWDREQTHRSIRDNVIEEACEVAEAIDLGDDGGLAEELGDLLLQVVFHAQIAGEEGRFDFDAVVNGICRKLVVRHPHVFAQAKAENADEVLDLWDDVKRQTKGHDTAAKALEGVARSLPGTWRAAKLLKKARKAGLEAESARDITARLVDETAALNKEKPPQNAERAVGSALFSLVQLAGVMDIDPERALGFACDDYVARMAEAEKQRKV